MEIPKNAAHLIKVFLLFMLIGFMIYANSLHGEFVWDDNAYIKNNSYLKDFSHISNIFKGQIEPSGMYSFYVYRPLQELTYLIDFQFWGLNVIGYHLSNTLLHILVAFLVYRLAGILFNNQMVSLFSGLLYLVHPVHTGAVAYISGRSDILAAIFILLSFMFYAEFLEKKKGGLFITAGLIYVLAILSKENALIFPVLILLYHYVFRKKVNQIFFLSILLINISYCLLRASTLNYLRYDSGLLFKKIPGFFVGILNYFRILFFPADLHMDYGNPIFHMASIKAILGLLIIIILVISVFVFRKKYPLVSFSSGWFLIALLPTTGIYPASLFYMAEHWLYLPSIGFFVVISYGLTQIYQLTTRKWIVLSLVGIVFLSYSLLTIKQNKYWTKEISLYERILKFNPASSMAHNNLGLAYSKIGDYQKAINEYLKAVSFNPKEVLAYYNLGWVYSKIGDIQQSHHNYSKVIRLRANSSYAYIAMCKSCVINNMNEKALKYCIKAGQLDPQNEGIFYDLGEVYYRLGRKEEAVQEYKKAIAINPKYLEAYNNLASVYSEIGKIDEAISLWNKIIEMSPDFTTAHFNLSIFYFQKKEYALAVRHCDRVIELGDKVDPVFLKELEKFRK